MFGPCKKSFDVLIPAPPSPLRPHIFCDGATLASGHISLAAHFPPLRNLQASPSKSWRRSFGSNTTLRHYLLTLPSSQPVPGWRQILGLYRCTVPSHELPWRAQIENSVLLAPLAETLLSGGGPARPRMPMTTSPRHHPGPFPQTGKEIL
ncbi:hypothetical protein HPB49_018972 [Dermacentor silvarum]|uniref:Uncharacterized protein n=1 Tax=Dermacentor silvarum TaxID=543639 RepID=A0ACB8D7K5_DERSI|nr:hypothetical protein HPB49_018972 [Dermacentor silvarum]